jgi:very-short-patch-repair endonuclease
MDVEVQDATTKDYHLRTVRMLRFAVPEKTYRLLRTSERFDSIKNSTVKIICRDGQMLDKPEIEAIHPNHDLARRLRERAPRSEQRVARGLARLGFRHSVPMAGYILDFYNPVEKIAIEIDGPSHKRNEACDNHRDAVIRSHGARVWRFGADAAYCNPRDVVAQVKKRMRAKPESSAHAEDLPF